MVRFEKVIECVIFGKCFFFGFFFAWMSYHHMCLYLLSLSDGRSVIKLLFVR